MIANHQGPARVSRALSRWPVLLVLTVFLTAAPSLLGQEVNWRTEYGKALKEAGELGRPLLVEVGTETCYWCKQLESRTLKDADLVKMINERFVPLKVDGSKNAYLVQALRVQSYPTLVLAGPDGTILHYKEGFVEAAPLREQMVKALAAVAAPDWMLRDYEVAGKAVASGDFARAMSLLRGMVEDGRDRPIQVKARKLLEQMEKQAERRALLAKDLVSKGKATEAITAINDLRKSFPGTLAAREGKQLLLKLTNKIEATGQERRRAAEELLKQAREDYKSRQLSCCLDRCEMLASTYADLPEGAEGDKLAAEIKSNPEWAKQACDQLGERLSVLYLALADSWLKKGQPQQALFYLERVVKMFPGSQQAETASLKMARLRGVPAAKK